MAGTVARDAVGEEARRGGARVRRRPAPCAEVRTEATGARRATSSSPRARQPYRAARRTARIGGAQPRTWRIPLAAPPASSAGGGRFPASRSEEHRADAALWPSSPIAARIRADNRDRASSVSRPASAFGVAASRPSPRRPLLLLGPHVRVCNWGAGVQVAHERSHEPDRATALVPEETVGGHGVLASYSYSLRRRYGRSPCREFFSWG